MRETRCGESGGRTTSGGDIGSWSSQYNRQVGWVTANFSRHRPPQPARYTGILSDRTRNEARTREPACPGTPAHRLSGQRRGPLAGTLHQPRGSERQRLPLHPHRTNRAGRGARREPAGLLVARMVAGLSRAAHLPAAGALAGRAGILRARQVRRPDDRLRVGALSVRRLVAVEFLCGGAAHGTPSAHRRGRGHSRAARLHQFSLRHRVRQLTRGRAADSFRRPSALISC